MPLQKYFRAKTNKILIFNNLRQIKNRIFIFLSFMQTFYLFVPIIIPTFIPLITIKLLRYDYDYYFQ